MVHKVGSQVPPTVQGIELRETFILGMTSWFYITDILFCEKNVGSSWPCNTTDILHTHLLHGKFNMKKHENIMFINGTNTYDLELGVSLYKNT